MSDFKLESNTFAPPEETTEKSRDLISSKSGLIKRIESIGLQPDDPSFYHCYTELGDISRFSELACYQKHGGAAVNESRAKGKAIGEAVERYCSSFYWQDSFIRDSYKNLKIEAAHPQDFILFSEKQHSDPSFPYSRFNEDTITNWVPGFSLVNPRKILVPANFVYVPYQFATHEEHIVNPISTGLACGNTREEALLSGLNEIIERDAFMITWLNRLPLPKIQFDSEEFPVVKRCIEHFEQKNIDVIINDITLDIPIPVYMVTLLSHYGGTDVPAAVVATNAGLDPEHTLLCCLEEAAHTRIWARMLMRDFLGKSEEDPEKEYIYSDIQDNKGHVLFYCHPNHAKNLDFLTKSKKIKWVKKDDSSNTSGPLDQLKHSVAGLAQKNYEVIGVDVTTPDVEEIGLYVMRTIIPGLHPLHLGYTNRCLGGKRLYEMPKKLGYVKTIAKEKDLNPHPHPFP